MVFASPVNGLSRPRHPPQPLLRARVGLMKAQKPTFVLHEDAESSPASRSTSRERARRYSHDEGTRTPPSHHLCDLDEESALESTGGESENDALLANGRSARGTPKRRRTLPQNGYGTLGSPHGNYLTLNEGAPFKRTESILRLTGLIDDRAGEYEKFRKSDEELKKMPKKDAFIEVDEILDNARAKAATGELLPIGLHSSEKQDDHRAAIALVFLSHSMSLIASTVDSAMDLLSTVIVFGTSRYLEHRDWKSSYIYPTGKRKMEPLGVLIFSVFMISSFLQVFIESVNRLFDENLEFTRLPLVALLVMVSTIVIKAGVWLSCRAIKSASVEALQQDAENDIVFNFFSTLFPFAGQLIGFRYLDAMGGALLSLYIGTLLDNVRKLTGRRAPPQEHQRIAYLLTRFSPLVTAIQHLSLYYSGEGMVCEVDIVLPASTSLTASHNLGEACQYAIEQLSGIERAFVHVDCTVNPHSGHLER
ncbi:putative Cation diffusion facilitator [Rhodotorula toruloides ATCC 204091]|uniref:Putative cation diffusion facilitator n=1 Tax=Rhodotorula toruloides TaxID=5286 RepID=A0A2T0AAZ7_RHOTO|nr:putative Cation diffusion facilitator [Rhodotorula toruloides ATCC 204091]PRQ75185.1 putative cation diffusion facilitator [Rhodotorula toruloides]